MKELEQPQGVGCPVHSFNEWDPLEEIIVGRLEGAVLPGYHCAVVAVMPPRIRRALRWLSHRKYPGFVLEKAQRELDGFIGLLQAEGVRVRRPEILDHAQRFQTPWWRSKGYNNANPRDGLMVLGNEILETPMAWRCRYFEIAAYRSLLKEYFAAGAVWNAAPKPLLKDDLFNETGAPAETGPPRVFATSEAEPVFDAADFVRCGRDIFGMRSHVTNRSGIHWLERHIHPRFRFHEVRSTCALPMHIDTTLMPLAPGKVMVNPDFVDPKALPQPFRKWDVLVAPPPDDMDNVLFRTFGMTSPWIGMNVLMLDEERVVVERSQLGMRKALKNWGFKPIPLAFSHYAFFGGSFHCSTLDVRRRGTLQEYF